MTSPPPLTLCQELHKLAPGWTDTSKAWRAIHDLIGEYVTTEITDEPYPLVAPLYDTDYLLDKLKPYKPSLFVMDDDTWCAMPTAGLSDPRASTVLARNGDTPAEALISLAITLIREEKLKP